MDSYRTYSLRRRSGRSQLRRVEALEQELMPPQQVPSGGPSRLWAIEHIPEYATEYANPLCRILEELGYLTKEAAEAGEVIWLPRIRSQWPDPCKLSPERRVRYDELMQRFERLHATFEAWCAEAQEALS